MRKISREEPNDMHPARYQATVIPLGTTRKASREDRRYESRPEAGGSGPDKEDVKLEVVSGR